MLYKGLEIDDTLYDYIRHIRNLEEYRAELQQLQIVWDNLTLLGRLSRLSIDMSDARNAFQELTSDLLNSLSNETLKKSFKEAKFKAQVTIDILVRNLFERTADIGFFAVDDNIRHYLLQLNSRTKNAHDHDIEALKSALLQRFDEYQAKYSVYHNIILLDTQGNLLLQLDQLNPLIQSHDPLIAESLQTEASYVETFRHTDLVPDKALSLVYSSRVVNPENGNILGVVCLCFRFENECAGIFTNFLSAGDHSIISLLNQDGRVIASSDTHKLPLNSRLHATANGEPQTVRHEGHQYLACSRKTTGYQGYSGPEWYGHVMVPIELAFHKDVNAQQDVLEEEVQQCIMQSPTLFDDNLRKIPQRAEVIQRNLNRSVWNGNLEQHFNPNKTNVAISRELLKEIRNTSIQTKAVFEKSITDLQNTVLQASLNNAVFLASFAIDIMDRNLYERSNDSRWWALNSTFSELLESGMAEPRAEQKLTSILRYINSLYTVYTSIILFDRHAKVVAVSYPENDGALLNMTLSSAWAEATLLSPGSHYYAVSAFEKTALYHDQPSYIYAAAIRGKQQQVVGGVAVIFDAAPQFMAMLTDALPKDENGQVIPGSFAVFADKNKNVIASTREDILPGQRLNIDDDFFALENGAHASRVIRYGDDYYAVGCKMSMGYREFKQASDCYQNDVLALIFIDLNHIDAADAGAPAVLSSRIKLGSDGFVYGNTFLIASFYVGSLWLSLAADNVVAAVATTEVRPSHHSDPAVAGFIMHEGQAVWTIWLAMLIEMPVNTQQPYEIVILRFDDGSNVGLIVDQLGETLDINNDAIQPVNAMQQQHANMVDKVVVQEASQSSTMLQIINPTLLQARVKSTIAGMVATV